MYCTGGIRCDIYSTLLRERGYSNLYTLEGGVAAYLREMGSGEWKGSLFTFDDRMALAAGLVRSRRKRARLRAMRMRSRRLGIALVCHYEESLT